MDFFEPGTSIFAKVLIAMVGAAIIVAMVLAVVHSVIPHGEVEAERHRGSSESSEGTVSSFGERWADRRERSSEEWGNSPGQHFAENWADR